MGLASKPTANMNNYQTIPIEEVSEVVLDYNIKMFRQINGL
jgi:hypothetical protein